MTLPQLRTFLAVVKHGSISGAAAELFVTQPAVSAAIAALERELGVRLTAREGRGIRLTPAGEALAGYAREALGLLEQGRDAALAAERPGRGRLRIVAVTTAGEYVVPPMLKEFQEAYPRVEVSLEVGNRALVVERLLTREADLGVGGRPPANTRIEGQPFLDNHLVVVAAPDHPLAGRSAIDPRRIEDVWLLREPGSGTRMTTEEFLLQHDVQPRGLLSLGSNGAIKQAVAVGLGVALISEQAVALELATRTLIRLRIRGTPLKRRWYFQAIRGGFLPGPARAFLEFARGARARRAVRSALKAPAGVP